MDIKNFYLKTPMVRYEYMHLKLADMPDDVIEHYKLHDVATPDGYVYCEIRKGMYGLPQAGIIAQELLAKRLKEHGYSQSETTPGLWNYSKEYCFQNICQEHPKDTKICGTNSCKTS